MTTKNYQPMPAQVMKMLFPLSVLLAATALAAPAATSATAPAAPANARPSAASLQPVLPLDFAAFAPDYHAEAISPPWLNVQVGTLETNYAPPANKNAFVLEEATWITRPDLQANYHPVEFSCLMGAKSRYENITLINLDKASHPLGYTVALGQTIYFLARGESAQGITYSIHYYDSGKDLIWVPNPENNDAYIPRILPVSVTQDLAAPAESYVFLYINQRIGELHPGSTARPLTMYNYLVIHIHRLSAITPAPATGIVPQQ